MVLPEDKRDAQDDDFSRAILTVKADPWSGRHSHTKSIFPTPKFESFMLVAVVVFFI